MYKSTLQFARSSAEKADQLLSWNRPDEAFFAAGACHILAYTFLQLHPNDKFNIIYIKPINKLRGHHVFVTNGVMAFDFNGWSKEGELLEETRRAYSEKYSNWDYERIIITDKVDSFCKKNNHQLLTQFPFPPEERALNYIKKFASSLKNKVF